MWRKRGLIFGPEGRVRWASHSALTPTPILLGDKIRVFAGFRDAAGVSRIGFVDLDADDPSKVIAISDEPALDVGAPGHFDDNGVILGDVIAVNGEWWMYYVGFQLVSGIKFLAFSGSAISDRSCRKFVRVSNTPLLDRSDEGQFIRAIHTVRKEGSRWKVWYAVGRRWEILAGQPYPSYEIRYLESTDGQTFDRTGRLCLAPEGDEYRIGRPRVSKTEDGYAMLFTKGDRHGSYLPAYASSKDGRIWHRDDASVGITLSASGWDSRTLCYATVLTVGRKTYLFYNGNEMGRAGFGYAELADA